MTTATLFCFGNFMKKEGRSRTAGEDSWRALLFRHVAADKLGRRDEGWWGWVEGERTEMMKGGGRRERERELWSRASWVTARHAMAVLLLLPPSSQFHFHGLLKISQVAISFSLPTPPPVFARHGTAGYPSPGSSGNTYVPITFFFCR